MEPALFLMDVRIITGAFGSRSPCELSTLGAEWDHWWPHDDPLPLAQGLFDPMGMVNLVVTTFPLFFFSPVISEKLRLVARKFREIDFLGINSVHCPTFRFSLPF